VSRRRQGGDAVTTSASPRPPGPAGGLFALASAVQFGVVVVFASRLAHLGLPVAGTLALRFGIASVILFVVLAALGRPLAPAEGERGGLVLIAVAGYAVEASIFFTALAHGTAAAVTLLFYTYPVVVALASWLVLRRGAPARGTAVALLLATAGVAIVVGVGGPLAIEPVGVLLALLSSLVISGYMLGADVVLRRTQSLTSAAWVSGAASLALFAASLVSGAWRTPSGWSEWAPIVAMGVATAGAFVCLLEGIRRIGAERSSIVSSAEPLAAAVLARMFLDQAVGVGVAIGGVLILGGAILASLARDRIPEHEAAIP
jgi:drug/metabolite transporter (DMT)-like permease